jgi:hypothetical protein
MGDLEDLAREVIDANRYMVLGTSEADGSPRVSPVWFTHAGHRAFYWVSGPDAHHSHNVRARPDVAIVIYDSTAAVGAGRAVYLTATAVEVPEADLPAECKAAFTGLGKDAIAFTPEELSGDGDLRLYVARPSRYEVHIPGGHPLYGQGIDTRREINPP